jgi:hypothetical protein
MNHKQLKEKFEFLTLFIFCFNLPDNSRLRVANKRPKLKGKLEQEILFKKQMQDYVNFLKNTYIAYFDSSLFDSPHSPFVDFQMTGANS